MQRTAAIGRLLNHTADEKLFIVTYPEALEEKIPSARKLSDALFVIKEGEEIPYESIRTRLLEEGFEKVDFVSAPGQFALRGAVIDIFSYSLLRCVHALPLPPHA